VTTVIKLADRERGVVWELGIVLVDPHLLVLNKPAGPDVHPPHGDPECVALLPLLHRAVAEARPWAKAMGLEYLVAPHRPEAQTSGVLVLARSREVLDVLAGQFASGSARQEHWALVRGGPSETQFELDAKLVPHPDRPGQMRSDSKRGKRYRTRCEVLERFRGYTLLRCTPSPGRPGQITAHLRHARLPLVADPDRGGAGLFLSQLKRDYVPKKEQEERPLIGRPALHLETVQLQHPVTGDPLLLTAPLARDFGVALKYLRRFAA
jgi:23S rRNA pseudouridine1911/1915/1917 synthase